MEYYGRGPYQELSGGSSHLASYRFRNLLSERRAKKADTQYFFADLRPDDGRSSRGAKLMVDLFDRAPYLQGRSPDKQIKFNGLTSIGRFYLMASAQQAR